MPLIHARRRTLRTLLQTGLTLAAPAAWPASSTAAEIEGRPVAPGAPKFNTDGSAAHWPGNTIICPIDRRSTPYMALLDAHACVMRSGVAHRLAVLPPASYHMTVFEGIAYAQRHKYYPADLPASASAADCDAYMVEKLRHFDLGCSLPLRMRPLPLAEQTNRSAIWLEPADSFENCKLRDLRDRLSTRLQMRASNHESYRFHISLNYVTSPMDDVEEARFALVRAAILTDFIARAPLIELGRPALTFFDDMFEFRPQFYLDRQGAVSG